MAQRTIGFTLEGVNSQIFWCSHQRWAACQVRTGEAARRVVAAAAVAFHHHTSLYSCSITCNHLADQGEHFFIKAGSNLFAQVVWRDPSYFSSGKKGLKPLQSEVLLRVSFPERNCITYNATTHHSKAGISILLHKACASGKVFFNFDQSSIFTISLLALYVL